MNENTRIAKEVAVIDRRLAAITAELSGLPDGKLVEFTNHNKHRFARCYMEDNKRKLEYLGSENKRALLIRLARKEYIKAEEKILRKNRQYLIALGKHYIEPLPVVILNSISGKLRTLPTSYFTKSTLITNATKSNEVVAKDIKLDPSALDFDEMMVKWGEAKYIKSLYKEEGLTQVNSKGERMRSKSEVLISEILISLGIPYHYEEELADSWKYSEFKQYNYIPDFTVKNRKGETIYWEHLGRLDLENYKDNVIAKLFAYAKMGILPGKNLILTYDDEHGNINLADIKQIAINVLL